MYIDGKKVKQTKPIDNRSKVDIKALYDSEKQISKYSTIVLEMWDEDGFGNPDDLMEKYTIKPSGIDGSTKTYVGKHRLATTVGTYRNDITFRAKWIDQ